MVSFDELFADLSTSRRRVLLAPVLATVTLAFARGAAQASRIDPSQTAITLPGAMKWVAWSGLPPRSGEMATLYGGLDQPGPYLVLMKWYPGWMSAPHSYATDRLSLVLSGTWWVNSGPDIDPGSMVPVPAGGFVRRVARTTLRRREEEREGCSRDRPLRDRAGRAPAGGSQQAGVASVRSMRRRQFMQSMAALGAGAALGGGSVARGANTGSEEIPRRPLGRTGAQVSAIGVGGHHLGDLPSVDDAVRLVHEATDAGVTFFDNCWEYYNGKTEAWLGQALQGRRDRVFLMTKVCTHGRTGDIALRMLEESLRRLRTDHLDLWQIHGIVYDNDPELAYAKGGVLEAFDKAKKQGKTRFVGFTGHKEPSFHARMLALGYPFDSVQMPLNPFDASFHSFEKEVLPEVNRRGMAALGMKPMGGTAWVVKQGLVTAEELLRYAMSLPVAVTICGMDSQDVLHHHLRVARGFTPMTAADMDALRARCAATAADGRYEPYKVSLRYDNPITRLPHGFPLDPTQREVKAMLHDGTGTWETR